MGADDMETLGNTRVCWLWASTYDNGERTYRKPTYVCTRVYVEFRDWHRIKIMVNRGYGKLGRRVGIVGFSKQACGF